MFDSQTRRCSLSILSKEQRAINRFQKELFRGWIILGFVGLIVLRLADWLDLSLPEGLRIFLSAVSFVHTLVFVIILGAIALFLGILGLAIPW